MEILKNDDPRSPLDRARRPELVAFAQANGMKEITEAMPALLIRKRLRSAGLVNINVPPRPLGSTYVADPAVTSDQTPAVDALDDLERQFAQQSKSPSPAANADTMTMGELRNFCKSNGVKMERRDNMQTLRDKVRAKLNG